MRPPVRPLCTCRVRRPRPSPPTTLLATPTEQHSAQGTLCLLCRLRPLLLLASKPTPPAAAPLTPVAATAAGMPRWITCRPAPAQWISPTCCAAAGPAPTPAMATRVRERPVPAGGAGTAHDAENAYELTSRSPPACSPRCPPCHSLIPPKGGPMLIRNPDGSATEVGITSHGPTCPSAANAYGYYTGRCRSVHVHFVRDVAPRHAPCHILRRIHPFLPPPSPVPHPSTSTPPCRRPPLPGRHRHDAHRAADRVERHPGGRSSRRQRLWRRQQRRQQQQQ